MTCLLIDTTKPQAWMVLLQDGEVIEEDAWTADRTLGGKLLSAIQLFLEKHDLTSSMIDRIAVHGGPGHYSALRTGVVTASLLAKEWEVELVQLNGGSREELIEQALKGKAVPMIVPRYEET